MRDDDKPSPAAPTKLKTFNGTPEQLEELMAMLEELRLPDDEAPPPPSETQSSTRPPDSAARTERACTAAPSKRNLENE
jgi:hypothetical protein